MSKNIKNSTQDKPTNPTRRDFLAGIGGVAAASVLAGCSLPAPAIANHKPLNKAPKGAKIHSIGIYPPIGISRVGLREQTFPAPEVPGVTPNAGGSYKESGQDNGKLKRQVQRFFIYAYDENGDIISELTASNTTSIKWTVDVANSKAAWFGFNNPFDLGDTAKGIPAQLRNQSIISDAERLNKLIIHPQPKSITGSNINPNGNDPRFNMADHFWDDDDKHLVHLAALQTDGDGRLKVIPASGESKSVIPDNPIVDFTKNDAWHDDWCDGTVQAEVMVDGKTYTTDKPAWIACCGPNFAPDIAPFTSMYDTVFDGMIKKYQGAKHNLFPKPTELSFTKDIYPMFYNLGMMEWVSGAAATRPGWIDVGNFADVNYIKSLADNSASNKAQREKVFGAFHDPQSDKVEPLKIPFMVGSGINYDGSPKRWFNMTDYQYWVLSKWALGEYINDFKGEVQPAITNIEDLPLEQQPEALTKAALQPLSGGNFHPGVELTWILGHGDLYENEEPFRLKLGSRPTLYQNIGTLITEDVVFPPKGENYNPNDYPIGPQMPGDLTRWMGLPWQPDAFSCQNVNFANDFPTVVWWPALLPVDIMPEYAYKQAMRTDLSREERLKFASIRAPWARGAAGIGYHVNAGYFDGLNRMVYLVDRMGVVMKQPAPQDLTTGENALPEYLYVEMDRGSMDLEFDVQPNLGLGS